jgi:hypothetical protein
MSGALSVLKPSASDIFSVFEKDGRWAASEFFLFFDWL